MSPKNKGKFGKGKTAKGHEELAPEDEFVSTMGRLGKRLEPHAKRLTIATAITFSVLLVFFAFRWWGEQKEAKATIIYQKALKLAQIDVLPPDDPPDDPGDGGGDADGENGDKAEGDKAGDTEGKDGSAESAAEKPPEDSDGDGIPDNFRSVAQRATAVIAELDRLQAVYGSTQVAAEARLLHGTMLYDLGKYDEAGSMFRAYLSGPARPDLRRLARERLGLAQEAEAMASDEAGRKAGLQKALETFRKIQGDDDGPGRDLALYHEARILAALGEREKAEEALKKAKELENASGSDIRYEIDQRLVLLKKAR